MRHRLRYGYGGNPFTFFDATWILGVVTMGTGIRFAIFGNPQYKSQNLLLAFLGLLVFSSCAVYSRRKRRYTQELE